MRNILAADEFERAGAEDGAQRGVDARHRPAIRERRVDRRVDVELGLDHARDDLAKEIGVGGQVLLAFDLAPQMMGVELRQRFFERLPADIHLVERLHRREPGGAALVGGPVVRLVTLGSDGHLRFRIGV